MRSIAHGEILPTLKLMLFRVRAQSVVGEPLCDIDATNAGSPAALSDCAARRRGGDLAILLILSRRINATKVSTLRGTF
jgi:hypothetical protein